MNRKMRHQGFTLIELLIVIAIIGILAGVTIIGFSSSRAKGRDSMRRADLQQLQLALTYYHEANGSFPSTGGAWYSSEPSDPAGSNNGGNYIPGLAPTYMEQLPRDPRSGTPISACASGSKGAYLYRSDGRYYKLIANCSPESAISASDQMYDPVRPTTAWKVCVGVTGCAW